MNDCSRKVKIEGHGAHKCPRVANFGVRDVLSTTKIHKSFHDHRVKPAATR